MNKFWKWLWRDRRPTDELALLEAVRKLIEEPDWVLENVNPERPMSRYSRQDIRIFLDFGEITSIVYKQRPLYFSKRSLKELTDFWYFQIEKRGREAAQNLIQTIKNHNGIR